MEPLCRVLKPNADYCELEGDIRVDSNSSTVFLIRPISSSNSTTSWTVQPYPRKRIKFVKEWTVRLASDDGAAAIPKCDSNHHRLPALLLSLGGLTGNHFHDFADILFPLFTTAFQFKKEVQFLASDYKQWWPPKYRPLLNQLTRHDMLDIDSEHKVHCYAKMIIGLRFYGELVVYPDDSLANFISGVSMQQFRQLLRRTYSLGRTRVDVEKKKKPRLMIVSRKRTRILSNEDEVRRQARKLGYEVVSAEVSANLTEFAQLVNSCDVMMGVHGAGLTNMVFLPENAVLIQVVPLGKIDIFAKRDFGNPTAGMKIRYLDYKIETRESSLSRDYPADHPVLRDPMSIHWEGWGKLTEVYFNNQNVTIDVPRFLPTLVKALRLLRR